MKHNSNGNDLFVGTIMGRGKSLTNQSFPIASTKTRLYHTCDRYIVPM